MVDLDLKIIWANPEFHRLSEPGLDPVDCRFYRALGSPEVLGPDPCPFTTAVASREPSSTAMRIGSNRYLRVTVTPVFATSANLPVIRARPGSVVRTHGDIAGFWQIIITGR